MKLIMACDCGATGTRAGLYNDAGECLAEREGGPANAIEHGPQHCATVLAQLAQTLAQSAGAERIDEVAAGIAGAARPHLRGRIAETACEMLGARRVRVTDDLHPILVANAGGRAAIVATAGTGSSVLAQLDAGKSLIVGGHGRVFGDDGSAYGLAVAALRAAANAYDGAGPETVLVDALPAVAGLQAFAQLVQWAAEAPKNAIAALAHTVVTAAVSGDQVAFATIREQAALLGAQTLAAARRLGLPGNTPVFMNGSLFTESEFYANAFKLALEGKKPVLSPVFPLKRRHQAVIEIMAAGPSDWFSESAGSARGPSLPSTERRLERGAHLDELEPLDMVRKMAAEDLTIPRTVLAEAHNIAAVIEWVAAAIRGGGRLIYAGAGTSGRLGVLDASECPPTFGIPRDRVIALIAGGDRALRESVELAEDDAEAGARELAALNPAVGIEDVVIAISASGRTPYALGALREADRRSAKTALLCCNPPPARARERGAQIVIALETGPEVVAGSTRLKAGTATKMVLNMITTGAMARAGYVFEGYMVGVQPVNDKLVRRAGRIIAAITGKNEDEARQLLQDAGGSIGVAVLMAQKNLEPEAARDVLKKAGGSLREALQ